ncbi:hypothetical protein H5410_041615 [Solanum commersonii]|uniref:Uncharacterized protein n=1 Tax=Solanum commersonii TaxID=4109 RepID=A0A9J5XTE1_SOLCO|nr:hypothetical protein H5410_041615 [Solanum commersonii]
MSKDVNKNIPLNGVKFSKDIKALNNFSWDHESYELTVKYLLAPLSSKTNNLLDFHELSWYVEILFNPLMDIVKRESIGATTIKRERVDTGQLVVFNEGMVDVAIRTGVNIGVGAGEEKIGDIGEKLLGLPLVVDVLAFNVRSARNKITMLSSVIKN